MCGKISGEQSKAQICKEVDSHGVCTLVASFHMESMNFILWFDFGWSVILSNISGSVRQGFLNCIISFNKIFELGLSLQVVRQHGEKLLQHLLGIALQEVITKPR